MREEEEFKLTVNDVNFDDLDFLAASLAPQGVEAVEFGTVTVNGEELNPRPKMWTLIEDLKDKLQQKAPITRVKFFRI